jgi:homoserine kinase
MEMVVRVRVPASSANLGPGYDVFSVALENPHLEVYAEAVEGEGVKIVNIGEYAGEVTDDPERHAGARAAHKLLSDRMPSKGVLIRVNVSIPPRKGLGLSGAEAAGAVYAVNHLYKLGLTANELIQYAAYAEPGGHLDNVTASLLGGFTISMRDSLLGGMAFKTLRPPDDLGLTVIIPDVHKTSTEDARKAVPDQVSRQQLVEAVARSSLATASLALSDVDLLFRCVLYDPYVELARADAGVYGHGVDRHALLTEKLELYKRYHVVETISGAGPSRLLWYKLSENSGGAGTRPVDRAVEMIGENLASAGYKISRIYHTRPSAMGCQLY